MTYPISMGGKRVLLLGRDPVFAWALAKILTRSGFEFEHVYTLTEARYRSDRFTYRAFLLDGLRPLEVRRFVGLQSQRRRIILFGTDMEAAGEAGGRSIPKESPFEILAESLMLALAG